MGKRSDAVSGLDSGASLREKRMRLSGGKQAFFSDILGIKGCTAGDESESPFDNIPDDVLVSIMAAVSAKASSVTDLFSAQKACRRMRAAGEHAEVLRRLPGNAFGVVCAKNFTAGGAQHSFLSRAAEAGNWEAAALLGGIEFYCLGNRREGARLLVRAARAGHGGALHSLALIHLNGSGSSVSERKLSVGVLLCASAAQHGHVDALRELGHCLQDGYGIAANPAEGRRLIYEANIREIANQIALSPSPSPIPTTRVSDTAPATDASLDVERRESPANTTLDHPMRMDHSAECLAASQNVPPMSPRTSGVNPSSAFSPSSSGSKVPLRAAVFGNGARSVPTSQHLRGADGKCKACRGRPTSNSAAAHAMLHRRALFTSQHAEHRPALTRAQQQPSATRALLSSGANRSHLSVNHLNAFLVDWFAAREGLLPEGLKMCGNSRCGRPETRPHEFRCCAVCSGPSYCSRTCQAYHWKSAHVTQCRQHLLAAQVAAAGVAPDGAGEAAQDAGRGEASFVASANQ